MTPSFTIGVLRRLLSRCRTLTLQLLSTLPAVGEEPLTKFANILEQQPEFVSVLRRDRRVRRGDLVEDGVQEARFELGQPLAVPLAGLCDRVRFDRLLDDDDGGNGIART